MKESNEYTDLINKKLKCLKESNKHRTRIINTEYDDIVNDFDVGIFKLETITFFKECFSTKKRVFKLLIIFTFYFINLIM